jgi:hypothetical protein
MPVVYVHGVATRTEDKKYAVRLEEILTYLKRFIAPAIAPQDPAGVAVIPCYWGDAGVKFHWERVSRPRSPLLGQGGTGEETDYARVIAVAEAGEALDGLPLDLAPPDDTGGLLASGASEGGQQEPLRLATLAPEALSHLLATVIRRSEVDDPEQRALLVLAADDVAHRPGLREELEQCRDSQEELDKLLGLVAERYAQLQDGGLLAQGGEEWLREIGDRVGEAVGRAVTLPGFVVSRLLAELRRPLNDFATLFVGDVLSYINFRGSAEQPGRITLKVLDSLAHARDIQRGRPGEPLVVLSHSMGGQIIYDLVTYFLPQMGDPRYADIRIDYWCATASQVGLFEEMKQFRASIEDYGKQVPPAKAILVPFPDRRYLGGWWNVWDSNDFISFTAEGIIADVDDEEYNSGMSVLGAHSGYMAYPGFYRRFAARLAQARERNWGR